MLATPSGPRAEATAWRSRSVTAKSLTTGGSRVVAQVDADAEGLDDVGDDPADEMLGLVPRGGVEHAQRALELADGGDHVGGVAGAGPDPDQAGSGARVERRDRTAGSWVMRLPRANVRSSVRCGRDVWPPRPLRTTWIWSDAPVMGALADADAADVERRVAVQREDPAGRRPGTPSESSRSAPPGMTSSAGWKISRTRVGRPMVRSASASAVAAPISAEMWTS